MRFHMLGRIINFVHAQYFSTPLAYEGAYQSVSAFCELICNLPLTDSTYVSVLVKMFICQHTMHKSSRWVMAIIWKYHMETRNIKVYHGIQTFTTPDNVISC